MPRHSGEIIARSRSSPLITMDTPLFSLPMRFSAGTRNPRRRVRGLAAAIAHLGSFCATLKPGKSFSMMNADIRRAALTRSVWRRRGGRRRQVRWNIDLAAVGGCSDRHLYARCPHRSQRIGTRARLVRPRRRSCGRAEIRQIFAALLLVAVR